MTALMGNESLYIEPGSPWQNGFTESFNSRFRDELLSTEVFDDVSEAKGLSAWWRNEYNTRRPHSALKYVPPAVYAATCAVKPKPVVTDAPSMAAESNAGNQIDGAGDEAPLPLQTSPSTPSHLNLRSSSSSGRPLAAAIVPDQRAIDPDSHSAWHRKWGHAVGVQAETQIASYIFWPEQLPDGRRSSVAAVIRGLGGFSRLRGDVCWIIGKGRRSDQKVQLYGQHVPTPMDLESAAAFGGVPMVRDLTSGGIPPVERTLMPDGTTVDRLLPGPVGRSSAMTFFLAETIRPGLAEPNDPDNPTLRLVTSTHTPTELQVVDVLFHKDLPPMGPISYGLASELGGISAGFVRPDQRVMIHDAVTFEEHGSDIAGMHVPGLPQYPKLLGDICGRLNVVSRDFIAYRIKVAFSPIPCALLFEREMKPS